jgi:MOSC domain-containing protein YiiM
MIAVESVRLLVGQGIEGDRYARGAGTFSEWPRDHELTLVEAEVIEDVRAEWGLELAPGQTRRSVTTRGVRLNPLVGRRFRVGGVLCEGTRLCEPCAHLEVVTGLGGLARMLAGRGGLRALVLEDGTVRVGDTISVETE